MKNFLIISVVFFLLTSCVATHNGVMTSSSLSKPVKYVDIAYGVSQTEKFFGLGGISIDALILEAKRDLIKNRLLKQNEQYVNFTTDFKRTYIPFYTQTKVTLSADVVAFVNDTTTEMYSDIYRSKLINNLQIVDLFNVGDTIIDGKQNEGVIISIINSKKVRILYETNKNNVRTKTILLSKIYTEKNEYKGYKVGARYIYNLSASESNPDTSGKILGLGINTLLIRENNGALKIMKYND